MNGVCAMCSAEGAVEDRGEYVGWPPTWVSFYMCKHCIEAEDTRPCDYCGGHPADCTRCRVERIVALEFKRSLADYPEFRLASELAQQLVRVPDSLPSRDDASAAYDLAADVQAAWQEILAPGDYLTECFHCHRMYPASQLQDFGGSEGNECQVWIPDLVCQECIEREARPFILSDGETKRLDALMDEIWKWKFN